jgi:hypothetical protein
MKMSQPNLRSVQTKSCNDSTRTHLGPTQTLSIFFFFLFVHVCCCGDLTRPVREEMYERENESRRGLGGS